MEKITIELTLEQLDALSTCIECEIDRYSDDDDERYSDELDNERYYIEQLSSIALPINNL